MNSDIRISTSFRGNRKRRKLEILLGDKATSHLLDLWIGVAISRPNGVLDGWDETDIALEANYIGDPVKFVSALCDVGFIDCSNNTYSMHDWEEHNPYVSGARGRSDKARFSKLKQAYPGLHKKLSEEGVEGIDSATYQQEVGEWLAKGQRNASVSLAPSPSPSPSPSPKDNKAEKFDVFGFRPDWINEDDWRDIVTHRRKHKSKPPETERAYRGIVSQLEAAIENGYTLERCLDRWLNNSSWQGFNAEWMGNQDGSSKKGFKTKHDVNAEIQNIGARINEQTKFNPYSVLEDGDSGVNADKTRVALPEQRTHGGNSQGRG